MIKDEIKRLEEMLKRTFEHEQTFAEVDKILAENHVAEMALKIIKKQQLVLDIQIAILIRLSNINSEYDGYLSDLLEKAEQISYEALEEIKKILEGETND